MKTFLFAWKLYSTICSPICCIASFQNKAAIKRESYSDKLVEWVTDYSHMKYYLGSPVLHCGSKSVVFNLFYTVADFSTQVNFTAHFGQQN